MSAKKIIEIFSEYTRLPIRVKDVRAQMVELGIQDRIRFIGVELNTEVLRGHLVQYIRRGAPYAPPQLCADIYYAVNQDIAWRRLVCVKELMHVFDDEETATRTQAQVNHLVERISLPPGLQRGEKERAKDGLQVAMDKWAEFQALAILFPEAVKLTLAEKYPDDLNDAEIARLAGIPELYVRVLMSDIWQDFYKLIREI